MDYGKIIFDEFNQWIYNDKNQAGAKLKVIDASDLPEIIQNVVKKLTTPVVIKAEVDAVCCHNCKHKFSDIEYCTGSSATCGKFEAS